MTPKNTSAADIYTPATGGPNTTENLSYTSPSDLSRGVVGADLKKEDIRNPAEPYAVGFSSVGPLYRPKNSALLARRYARKMKLRDNRNRYRALRATT